MKDKFTYQGYPVSPKSKLDQEIDNRLAKANSAWCRLYNRVWNNKNLKKNIKVSLYKTSVLDTLLCGSESWVLYPRHMYQLEDFHQRCLRYILAIQPGDFISNVEVLRRAEMRSIQQILQKTQHCLARRVSPYTPDEYRRSVLEKAIHKAQEKTRRCWKDGLDIPAAMIDQAFIFRHHRALISPPLSIFRLFAPRICFVSHRQARARDRLYNVQLAKANEQEYGM